MDLVRMIEEQRFLGREFLVWLWFESELLEGHIEVPGAKVPLWLEGHITLEAGDGGKEQSKLRGAVPSSTPEAREAMRSGKMPTQVRARIENGEAAYAFTLKADTLGLSAVTIPAQLKDEGDERFHERIRLIEELEALMDAFYAEFLAVRLSPAWKATIVPAIMAWIHDEPPIDPAAYRKAKKRATPLGKKPKLEAVHHDEGAEARA